MGCSDSLPSSHFASFPSLDGTTGVSTFSFPSEAGHRLLRAWRYLFVRPHPRPFSFIPWNGQGLPGSWGTPCVHALLSDPGGTLQPGPVWLSDAAFRRRDSVGSRNETLSGLNHTACTLAVYASRHRSPCAAQDSLPAAGQLCRAGLVTRRVPIGSFRHLCLPPPPGFAWRNTTTSTIQCSVPDLAYCLDSDLDLDPASILRPLRPGGSWQ